MQWILLFLWLHCLVFRGPSFACWGFFLKWFMERECHLHGSPVQFTSGFPVLLFQSYCVNRTAGLRYLFLMSSCDKRSWFPHVYRGPLNMHRKGIVTDAFSKPAWGVLVALLETQSATAWVRIKCPDKEDGVWLSWLLEELLVCCLP